MRRRRNTYTDNGGEVYVGRPVLPTGVTEDDMRKVRKDRFWINVWRVYAFLVIGFMLFLLIALIVESIRVWLA